MKIDKKTKKILLIIGGVLTVGTIGFFAFYPKKTKAVVKKVTDKVSGIDKDNFPLRRGSKNEYVKKYQEYLNRFTRVPYGNIAEDGIFGRGTEDAARRYNKPISVSLDYYKKNVK